MDFLFFYGHQLPSDGSTTESCLSQWYPCIFEAEGILYQSMEQYMMAQKAAYFGDYRTHARILGACTPGDCKALGRMVSGFQEESWRQVREQIVLCGNFQKFLQNPPLKSFLLQTGDRVLAEASLYDRIWGIGMSKGQPGIQDPGNWRGLNLLGFALMQVRTMLRSLANQEGAGW
ncbi:NADAR family protein [Flavonifractor plautii]|uniref:NADAR family protein n=1 Tax=Flavonifractor plautii TaxID=292800 RepID=A0AAW6CPK8_FLAPL|nr:NADAR family protein [Flavonifractor plautii]